MSARKQLSICKIKEVLRLWLLVGLSQRQIAAAVRIARSTTAEYIDKSTILGVS